MAGEVVRSVEAQWGLRHTGKQQVVAGYYCAITLPGNEDIMGFDERSLRQALHELAGAASARGWTMLACGLDPIVQESGLSLNTGFAWDSGFQVHLLDTSLRLVR